MQFSSNLSRLNLLAVVAATCGWTLSSLQAFSPNTCFPGRLLPSSSFGYSSTTKRTNKRHRLLTNVLISQQQEAPAWTASSPATSPASTDETHAGIHTRIDITESPEPTASDLKADKEPLTQSPSTRQPTLYEILGTSPNATRADLKQCYVQLAKQLHPDVLLHNNHYAENGTNNNHEPNNDHDNPEIDFTKVAAAWRILSHPQERKRYDRSLEAQQFVQDLEEQWGRVATKAVKPAADWSLQVLEHVAVPLLRRATATTLACWQALFQDFAHQQQPEPNSKSVSSTANISTMTTKDTTDTTIRHAPISRALSNVLQAARRAGRAVDRMELLEECQALEQQAQQQLRRTHALQEKWRQSARDRLKVSLHTHQSAPTAVNASFLQSTWRSQAVVAKQNEDSGGRSWMGRLDQRLHIIRKEERALLEESKRMEIQAARLACQAQQLKRRAEKLATL